MNEDERVDWMLKNGYLVEMTTPTGSRFAITDKYREDFPEMGQAWDDLVAVTVNDLWQKGLLEVTVVDEEMRLGLSEEALNCDLSTLSEPEYAILTSIAEWLVRKDG
jgi:hypothetical protein